jgi:acetyl-CoA acetyltransferase
VTDAPSSLDWRQRTVQGSSVCVGEDVGVVGRRLAETMLARTKRREVPGSRVVTGVLAKGTGVSGVLRAGRASDTVVRL